MTPELILWGIPGSLSLFLFQLARPSRNRSGWDFVALTAFFGLINFTLSKLILATLRSFWPTAYSKSAHVWGSFFAAPNSFTLLLGIVVAFAFGTTIAIVWRKYCKGITRVVRWFCGKQVDLTHPDVFHRIVSGWLGDFVLVILTSGKVYVGILYAATVDPNETQRFIAIGPIMSGYRDDELHKVIFDTDYIGAVKSQDELVTAQKNRDLLISMNQVSTLTRFDHDLHEAFVEMGKTEVQSQKEAHASSDVSPQSP